MKKAVAQAREQKRAVMLYFPQASIVSACRGEAGGDFRSGIFIPSVGSSAAGNGVGYQHKI